MSKTLSLDELVVAVQANPKYRGIHPDLVRRVAAQEMSKGRNWKEAVKATRNKLHQMGGAYQEEEIDYTKWKAEMQALPAERKSPDVQAFAERMMVQHASTRERLPIVSDFYTQALAPLGQIQSVLDLACGLNPLCVPWMPLADGASYFACDIYADQIRFLDSWIRHLGLAGEAFLCDLTGDVPAVEVELALLLKTIPCLEQLDKTISARLLEGIRAKHLLVSFPARSLGGRSKGMVVNYEAHFRELAAGKSWQIQRFEFKTELAFLISR